MTDARIDLTTPYLDLELKNPLVVSACPLSERVADIRRMEEAGAAAVVMYSLFEEQLRTERAAAETLVDQGSDSFSEALGYFPVREAYDAGPARYLETLRAAVEATDIPIIASLNCETDEGWSPRTHESRPIIYLWSLTFGGGDGIPPIGGGRRSAAARPGCARRRRTGRSPAPAPCAGRAPWPPRRSGARR